ncbi:MAG: SDR family oxidoreductase [Cyanophyceae cyanobacterium]
MTTIFVAGATGETGRRVVRSLLNRDISVKALVRDESAAKEILPEGVEFVSASLASREELGQAIAGCDGIISATGARPSLDVTGPYKVDCDGTKKLVDAAKDQGIDKFIMVSSLCVSQFFHPLNLFWLVLYWKLQAEIYLKNSGLNYTIVRPGGLKNEDSEMPVIMKGADSLFEGSIPRSQVAEVCAEALSQPDAANKIVEIVASDDAPQQAWPELFASVA